MAPPSANATGHPAAAAVLRRRWCLAPAPLLLLLLFPQAANGTISGNTSSPTAASATRPVRRRRKNILLLLSDSMDGRVLDPDSPVYGRLRMPHLRHLAKEGVNFVRTYTPSPQCAPARSAMFAGRHTHQIKAWSNQQSLAATPSTGELDKACVRFYGEEMCAAWRVQQNVSATFVDTLQSLEYDLHLYGKVDAGAGIINDPSAANATKNGFHNGPALAIVARSANIRKPTQPNPLRVTNDRVDSVHPEDWRTIGKCLDFLHGLSTAAPAERGWMLYCSINMPHPSFETNETWLAYVNREQVSVPLWLGRSEVHPYDSYMSISKGVWNEEFTDDEIRHIRTVYYAMCAQTDYMFGLVLNALRQSGQAEDTYIIFASDHGEMNMEHRQYLKNSMYEASSRVALAVAGPDIRRGAVVRSLTSLLDLYPTLVEMAGGAPPDFLSGKSLFPLLHERGEGSLDATIAGDERCVTSQYHGNMGNTGSFMLRCGRWKYVAFGQTLRTFANYTPQLFDIDADPEELHNIATEKPDVVELLDTKLRAVVDYPAVDCEVKLNDLAIFRQFFWKSELRPKLRERMAGQFWGFDEEDWKKLHAWAASDLSCSSAQAERPDAEEEKQAVAVRVELLFGNPAVLGSARQVVLLVLLTSLFGAALCLLTRRRRKWAP